MTIAHRILAACLTACGLGPAFAAQLPSADTMAWLVLHGNFCPGVCDTSDAFGPTQGIERNTYTNPHGGTTTAEAWLSPTSAHAYLEANNSQAVFDLSMRDVYTVHGSATAPFSITAHLSVDALAEAVWSARAKAYFLMYNYATVKIGSFNNSTAPGFSEQFRVGAFPGATATYHVAEQTSSLAFSEAMHAQTSYTRTVAPDETFELGYGFHFQSLYGRIDAMHSAHLDFDLPPGVWLTSANGAVFGTPPVPEPPAVALMAAGVLGLLMTRRRACRR